MVNCFSIIIFAQMMYASNLFRNKSNPWSNNHQANNQIIENLEGYIVII